MTEEDKDGTTPEAARAKQLRERIRKVSSGQATPKSPREITDAAAREQWEKDHKKPAL
jgi:hypothetical protein